ncbi:abhydrolase domain-containing protein [Apodospora peruviana]|uniref:Abhydrolase domain-containing protein n=1 Tax=Apodospora peruviana TaxID=516989 RepID=A0AAE0IIC1_9PEZI|nr:abhydrolase domain-containing protein [Apodospora peruviana]
MFSSSRAVVARQYLASPSLSSQFLLLTRPTVAAASRIRRGFATVPLVYDHHAPAKPTVPDEKTSPILFLHGLFGSKKNNRSISKALARDLGRHVYALDLRNHGESPHDHRHDYMAMAADVVEFISQHGLEQPTLIGHSMGAKTAMTVALGHPTLIANLVSVDNAPVDARLESDFARYVQGMKKVDAANVARQAEADKILEPYEKSLTIRQFLLGNLHRPKTDADTQKFRVPLDVLGKALDHLGDFPYKDTSQVRFERPALFIRGTRSKYVPDEVIPVIGQFFPRFELVDVEAGHWLISENPEAFRQGSFLHSSFPDVFVSWSVSGCERGRSPGMLT